MLIVLLYLPLAVLFLFSLNEGTSLSFPLQGLTLRWYEEVFSSPHCSTARVTVSLWRWGAAAAQRPWAPQLRCY